MITCRRPFSGLSHAVLAAVLMLTLGACASRPPVKPTVLVVSLTAVEVTALDASDRAFAALLQQRLAATAGRADADVGQSATMAVTLRQRGYAPLPAFISGRPRDFAWTSVVITGNADGRVFYTGSVRSVGPVVDADPANTKLVNRVAGDIRVLLGLESQPPYAIDAPESALPRPTYRPVADDPLGVVMAPEIADPLLNGTVTPTTMPVPLGPDDGQILDISRPLLSSSPSPQTEINPDAATGVPGRIPLPTVAPLQWRLRAATSSTQPANAQADGAEPCIVTVETDCQAPAVN